MQFDALQATRFLLEAESTGVPVTLVVNKSDLKTEDEVQQLIERLKSWGYNALMVSCETGAGIQELTEILTNEISVVVGPSGMRH